MNWRCTLTIYVSLALLFVALIALSKRADRGNARAETKTHHDDAYQAFQKGKCKSCHPAIWREWEKSMHAQAWTDAIYQAAAAQVADRENRCDACHAPEPILVTGIGKMPILRARHREAGVSCLVCHLDADGAMHGPPASAETNFHANITNAVYTEPTPLCATCHGQPSVPAHDLVTSFRESRFAAENKTCATCHMPAVKRLQSTASYERIAGRKHTWQGSRSVAQLKRAATLNLNFTENSATVTLQNKAGHLLPGNIYRVIVLDVTLFTAAGNVRQTSRHTFSEAQANRLPADARRTFVFDAQAGNTIEARLRYQLTTETPEASWIRMAEVRAIVP